MKRLLIFIAIALLAMHPTDSRAQAGSDRERILIVANRLEDAYGKIQSYACDIEGLYFTSGKETDHYVFQFYFRKPDLFRMEFQTPYPGVTIFYTEGQKEFTARPFSAFPSIQLRLSVDNPLFKSPAGQGVNQLHLHYFLAFLKRNARDLPQVDAGFQDEGNAISFWLLARDHVTGQVPERYHVWIDSRIWLPVRFERFDMAGTPLEITIFGNYRIDPEALDRAFFDSGYREPASSPPQEPVRP